jgi:CDP-glycerol glycerophosphotransferase (TagB/SpsB family)
VLKFKDEAPDNYVDLQVADVLVTNFSSIANLFYATRRPTVHVYPVASADEAFMWRTRTKKGTVERKIDSVRYIWKFPPEQNGGLLAHDFDQMLAQIEQGLADPDCCREVCEAFLAEHMLGADGGNCARIHEALCELVGR